jgi:outer membrane protein OmpA-like peptidoglycan-associated protein
MERRGMTLATALLLAAPPACGDPQARNKTTIGAERTQVAPAREEADLEPFDVTVLFAPGSSELDETARHALDSLGPRLSRRRTGSVAIEGWANEYFSPDRNLELAERRAQAVSRYLGGRSLDQLRYVAIGRESSLGDPRGPRCSVEVF